MTAGYTDNQAYPQWAGVNLLPVFDTSWVAGSVTEGPYLVDSFAGVYLLIDNTLGGAVTITLTWSEDSLGSLIADSQVWQLPAGAKLKVLVPAFGPYVSLTVNNTSGGNINLITVLAGTNVIRTKISYPVTLNAAHASTVSVPLSSTAYLPLPFAQSGEAYITFNANDATGHLSFDIVQLDQTGASAHVLTQLGSPSSTTVQGPTKVPLTDAVCALRIVNNDASGAHSYSAHFVAITNAA